VKGIKRTERILKQRKNEKKLLEQEIKRLEVFVQQYYFQMMGGKGVY